MVIVMPNAKPALEPTQILQFVLKANQNNCSVFGSMDQYVRIHMSPSDDFTRNESVPQKRTTTLVNRSGPVGLVLQSKQT
jgi:hypothetical protein